MKKFACISTFILFGMILSSNAQIPEKFQGTWDWTATNAAPGHDFGVTVITKDSVFINYTELQQVYRSEWVRVRSDTLKTIYLLYGSAINNWIIILEDGTGMGGYSSSLGEGEVHFIKTMEY